MNDMTLDRAITSPDTWIKIVSGTELEFQENLLIWKRPDRTITTQVKTASMRQALSLLLTGPVLRSSLPAQNAIDQLITYGFLVEGSHMSLLQSLSIHAESSPPFNAGSPYTKEQLLDMQDRASKRRFAPFSEALDTLYIPSSLLRPPSLSTSITREQIVPIADSWVIKLLHTLHDQQNRLYPSAGGLYPIQIRIEQRSDDEAYLLTFNTATSQIERKSLATNNHSAILDNTLGMATTRIWLSAVLEDTTHKYGTRGYRYSLLEAGHAAQVIIQMLHDNGISCRPFGGFDDEKAHAYLQLSNDEVVTYVLGAFRTAHEPSNTWVIAEEMRYAIINKEPIHYAIAYGGRDVKGRQIYGYATDQNPDLARLKSQAELAERIVLVKSAQMDDSLGNSNGMAAHTRWESCSRNAMLELYERHCMIRIWHLCEQTDAVSIPNTTAGRLAIALARTSKTKLIIKNIQDPAYGIPCLMAVVYSDDHGGIITSSSAALTETEAMDKALWEIIKSLFYRVIMRNAPVFPDNADLTEVQRPEDHEAFYARSNLDQADTEFLVAFERKRLLDPTVQSLQPLEAVITVQDLSSRGPNPHIWKIARAISNHLLLLEFGIPTDAYWTRLQEVLGNSKIQNSRLHPIG